MKESVLMCPYCKIISFQQNPTCELDGEYCFKVRPCTSDVCWKPFGDMDKCKNVKENKNMKLFKNEYKVRFIKNNKLYIEIPEEDKVITLENLYDYEPNKVKLVKDENSFKLADFYKKKENVKKENKK